MYIARILYPVKVLGPGNRIGIWFDGCKHHCYNCSNPELWEIEEKYKVTANQVMKLIQDIATHYPIDGFTLTGGDPFLQPEALSELLPLLHNYSNDILIYTGYYYEDIADKYSHLVSQASVIIDGPYIDERNVNCTLRGSNNQRIFINPGFEDKYHNYIQNTQNEIQNFATKDGMISVGIHSSNFDKDIQEKLTKQERK